MKAKKALALLTVLAITATLTACSFSGKYRSEAVNAQVMKISGYKVSFQVMDLSLAEVTKLSPLIKPNQKNEDDTSNSAAMRYFKAGNSPSADVSLKEEDGAITDLTSRESYIAETINMPELPTDEEGEFLNPPPKLRESTTGYAQTGVTFTLDLSDVTVTKNEKAIDFSSLKVGDDVRITFNSRGSIISFEIVTNLNNDPFAYQRAAEQGDSAYTLDESKKAKNVRYFSQTEDENALRIDCAIATLDEVFVIKENGGSTDGEKSRLYGMNSALLVTDFAAATIVNSSITSSAPYADGIFCFGKNTTADLWTSSVVTEKNNSYGIYVCAGGMLNASELNVNTFGNLSPAVGMSGSDSLVKLIGGNYISHGEGSSAIDASGVLKARNAVFTAEKSSALVLKDGGNIELGECTLNSAGSDACVSAVNSSASSNAQSVLSIVECRINANGGSIFDFNACCCNIKLIATELRGVTDSAKLLEVRGGANVKLTAASQQLDGKISIEKGSSLEIELTDSSTFNGIIEAQSADAVLTVGEGCTFNLTGNCTLAGLENRGTVNFNGYTVTLADGSVLSD